MGGLRSFVDLKSKEDAAKVVGGKNTRLGMAAENMHWFLFSFFEKQLQLCDNLLGAS